jgi:dipeptidyl aminopeptidase/acylaminoacyl peptidase
MDAYEASRQMEIGSLLKEKYEYNHWPSLPRHDCLPPEGWNLDLILSVNRIHHMQLSADGTRLAFIWNREDMSDVYTMPSTGGWPGRLSITRKLTHFWTDETPQWSPDNRWLAFTQDDQVHLIPPEGGIPEKLFKFSLEARSPIWMPDGEGLLITADQDHFSRLLLTDRKGSWPRALTTGRGDDADARPSPDGKWVAYVHRPIEDLNRSDIGLVEVVTGNCITLVGQSKQRNMSPRWSPDCKTIAFLSQRTGFYEVWLTGQGGKDTRQLTQVGQDVMEIAWAPDGTRLVAVINRAGALDLALIDIQNGAVSDLRSGLGCHFRPCWSPDGKFIYVEFSDPGNPPDLFRLEVAQGEWVQLTFSRPPGLARLDYVYPERVSYASSGGLQIPAFLYRPKKPNGAVVVNPHGGPRGQYPYNWDIFAQYLVAKGYTFLAPNYRGGTGYGHEFEHANDFNWGIGDAQDCIAAARFLHTLDWIDPQRIAIFGGSYGGYLTICSLARDPDHLYACGVDLYGDADLLSSWAISERGLSLYSEMQLGHPPQNRQVYRDGSPINDIANIQKPLLILHGVEDSVVPNLASEQIVAELKHKDKTFEYKTYAGEAHGFLNRAVLRDVYARIERFLDWYLLPEGKW